MQLLTWTRLEKPVDANGKSALKLANFRNVKVLSERRYSLQSYVQMYGVGCGGGGGKFVPPIIPTSVIRVFEELYLR